MREVVEQGVNSTVFAYGQTSSGKTHTMRGTSQDPGVIPRAVEGVFATASACAVGSAESGESKNGRLVIAVSYMEIYNEEIRDLLAGGDRRQVALGISSRQDGGVVVQGLSEWVVGSVEEAMGLLDRGDAQRRVGETNMNARSSRSHAIFRLTVTRIDGKRPSDGLANESAGDLGDSPVSETQVRKSELMLVDLAGSERLGKTGAEGQRQREGAAINKSLLVLGTVISKLSSAALNGEATTATTSKPSSSNATHVPYRDSKLTRVLQPALGGNAKTAIICAMTPAVEHCDESHNSLMFACRAKTVVNDVRVHGELGDQGVGTRGMEEEAVKRLVKRKVESVTRYMILGSARGESTHGSIRRQSWAGVGIGGATTPGIRGDNDAKRARRVTCSAIPGMKTRGSDIVEAKISEETMYKALNNNMESMSILERYKRDLEEARKELKRLAQEKGDVLPALKEAQWNIRQLKKDVDGYKAEIARYKASGGCAAGCVAGDDDEDGMEGPSHPSSDGKNMEYIRDYEAQIAELQACADAASAHVRFLEEKADQESQDKEAAIAELEARQAEKVQSMENALRVLEDTCEKSKLEVDALQSESKVLKDENDALLKRIGMASGTLNALDELRNLKKKHREEVGKLHAQIRNLTVGSKGNERAAERACKDTNRLKNQIQELETKLKKAIAAKSALQSEKAAMDREYRTAKACLEKLNKNAERAAAAEERRRQPIIRELEETNAKLMAVKETIQKVVSEKEEATARAIETQERLEVLLSEASDLSAALESERAITADLSATLEAERAINAEISASLETRTAELSEMSASLQEANKNVARLNESAKQDRHKLEQGTATRAQLQAEIETLKVDKQRLEDSLEAAETKMEMIDELQLDLAAERSHTAIMKKNFEVMEKGLEDHKREVEDLKKTVADKDKHAHDLSLQMNEAVTKAARLLAELEAAGNEVRKTKSLLSQAENAIEEHETTITDIHQEKLEIEKVRAELEQEVETLREAWANGEDERAGLGGRVRDLEAELQLAQKMLKEERTNGSAKLDDVTAAHEAAMQLTIQELEQARSAREALELDIGTLRAENIKLALALDKLRGEREKADIVAAERAAEVAELQAKAATSSMTATEMRRSYEENLKSLREERDLASSHAAQTLKVAEALQLDCAETKAALEQAKADAMAEANAREARMDNMSAMHATEKALMTAAVAAAEISVEKSSAEAAELRSKLSAAVSDVSAANDALRGMREDLYKANRMLEEERAAVGVAKLALEELTAAHARELELAIQSAVQSTVKVATVTKVSENSGKDIGALESELRKSKRREEKLQAMMYRLTMDIKESGGCLDALKNLRSVRELEFDLERAQNQISRLRSQLLEQPAGKSTGRAAPLESLDQNVR